MTLVCEVPRSMLRRAGLVVLTLVVALTAHAATKGERVGPRARLNPGQFTWHPETSPEGPVLVVVSLPQQRTYVYRNGVLIGRSTVSTGREGKETPTGVFTVLQKKAKHTSNIYKGAAMPNMQRLTWTGIALHAGVLPGKPASAGCVRLPLEFSRLLFGVTDVGTTVVVADDASASALVAHPGALMATPEVMAQVRPENVVGSDWTWNPERAAKGPVSVVISGADRQVWVFRNGEPLGRAAITIDRPGYELPRGAFSYVGMRDGKRTWVSAGLDAATAERTLDQMRDHVAVAPEFLKAVQDVLGPGDTMVVTPHSLVPPSVAAAPIE
jgi:hypothetical protein